MNFSRYKCFCHCFSRILIRISKMGLKANMVLFVLWTMIISYVSCYPNHVPNSPDVCSKMIPGHGPRPQPTANPFEIVLNKQSMLGGNNLQVVLKGKNGEKFKGFYLQIRDQNGSPIGLFQSPNENESRAHTCFGIKDNAIHHTSRNDKERITVYWKAPEAYTGKVKVVATVVQDFETYWVGLQAPELVTVSTNSSDLNFDFLEKRETESATQSKTARILSYNPYSPYSPLSPWDSHNSSSEFLLSQPSDKSSTAIHKRQLFGNFDFHGGLYANRFPAMKPQSHLIRHPLHPPMHIDHPSPFLYNDIPPHTTSGFLHNKLRPENFPEFHAPHQPFTPLPPKYPPIDTPYPLYNSHSLHGSSKFLMKKAPELHDQHHSVPHFGLPYDKKNQNLKNNYLQDIRIQNKPYHKQATDPSYPNTGYFPKDILTKLTSYIPNTIYNAMSKNSLFSINKEDTYEHVWKPIKGVTTSYNANIPEPQSATNRFSMPKFGYLVYNPTSGNPFYVVPAENEDDFISKYIDRRNQVPYERHGLRNKHNNNQPNWIK
ncbi:unnamed protein product [Orchesella dallaii]|uniref:Reelin domain-containing protein n=1 Tax=Orchesella dallaii TaxID=48710 RepID=A0ABP1QFE7_9HEXA